MTAHGVADDCASVFSSAAGCSVERVQQGLEGGRKWPSLILSDPNINRRPVDHEALDAFNLAAMLPISPKLTSH
jgi:hypothetical protein